MPQNAHICKEVPDRICNVTFVFLSALRGCWEYFNLGFYVKFNFKKTVFLEFLYFQNLRN